MHYQINEEKAVWRNISGEVVVLNMESGHYYSLNKTGSLIWMALSEEKGLKEIKEKLARNYHLSSQEAENDVTALVDALKEEGLLSLEDPR